MTAVASTPAIIPHSRPFFGREEVEAASRVIQSRHIAQGAEVEALERDWSKATATQDSVAVGSGLAALRLALHAMGVREGSEVIVPAYSCIAILNAVLALGAKPVLADVEMDRWTLDPKSVLKFTTGRTAAVIAVHLFGMPARLGAIERSGLRVLEDCAHGIGGRANGKPFGGAGLASIASFYATKMIAGGEGGIVASSDERILEIVRGARNPADQRPNAIHLNDKLTDLEASIVRVQLGRLQWMLSERASRAARYSEMLSDLAEAGHLVLPLLDEDRIWYRYAVRLTGRMAADVSRELFAAGIHVDQPVWDLRGVVAWSQEFRASDIAFDRVLSLPLYPDLTAQEQERVSDAIHGALGMRNGRKR